MSAALIDPRPAPSKYATRPRTSPLRVCERVGCGAVFVVNSHHRRFCTYVCAGGGLRHDLGLIAAARRHWKHGLSTAEIGRLLTDAFGRTVTKNAVVGIAHRHGFPPRPSPIRRKAVG